MAPSARGFAALAAGFIAMGGASPASVRGMSPAGSFGAAGARDLGTCGVRATGLGCEVIFSRPESSGVSSALAAGARARGAILIGPSLGAAGAGAGPVAVILMGAADSAGVGGPPAESSPARVALSTSATCLGVQMALVRHLFAPAFHADWTRVPR